MGIKAFVLIVVDPAHTAEVFDQLQRLAGVSAVYQVMGPYDIVAVVEVENLGDVPALIAGQIRTIQGIESTTTCVTFPQSSDA